MGQFGVPQFEWRLRARPRLWVSAQTDRDPAERDRYSQRRKQMKSLCVEVFRVCGAMQRRWVLGAMLLIFLQTEQTARSQSSVLIYGKVIVVKPESNKSCEDIRTSYKLSQDYPGLSGVLLSYKNQQNDTDTIQTAADGKFQFIGNPRGGDYILSLVKAPVGKSFKLLEPGMALGRDLFSGYPSQVQRFPLCLVPQFTHRSAPGSNSGSTSQPPRHDKSPFSLKFFFEPISGAGQLQQTQPTVWNGQDINGVVNPALGAKAERAHIDVLAVDENGKSVHLAATEADGVGHIVIKLSDNRLFKDYVVTVSLVGYQTAQAVLSEDLTKDLTDAQGKLDFEVALEPEQAAFPSIAQAPLLMINDGAEVRAELHTADLLDMSARGVRSLDDFALLAAGVLPAPQGGGLAGPGISPGVGTAGQFSANGSRARAHHFAVDLL